MLRPDPAGTIQSLAAIGYTPEAAVADLVDNSIAAGATHIRITAHWAGARESWVSLVDDGSGMTQEELKRGLTVGGRGETTQRGDGLGRFGMGLKTASFSQAKQLIVASRPLGGRWTERTWDVDHVLAVGDWELMHGAPHDALPTLSAAKAGVQNSGTVVLWRRLTRLVPHDAQPGDDWAIRAFYSQLNNIETHLGMVFSRYLSGRPRLQITLNGQTVAPWDPFLRGHRYVERLAPEIPLPGVRVQGYVLPHRSRLSEAEYLEGGGPKGWLEQQGFYVYRRDRLIVAGDWLKLGDFRKDERHTLARISVELPLGQDLDWALDVKKSTAMPPGAMVGHLRRVAKATRERAANVINHRGRVVRDRRSNSLDFTWRVVRKFGRTQFVVNRDHALVRHLLDQAPELRADIGNLLSMVEVTLPIGLIQSTSDVGEQSIAETGEAVPDDVLDMARRMLDVLLSRGEKASAALSRVIHMPPFSDYPSLADTLSGPEPATKEGTL